DSQARERVAALLAEEVGMIFRMPPHEINLKRSLADIGMDSLMGMELRTAAKQRFGVELPMASIADGTTIVDIASRIVDRARSFAGDTGRTSDAILIAQHSPGAGVGDAVESILEKVRDEDGDLASLI